MDDLIKFPRTEHIFDAGGSAIARDDLLIDPKDAHARFLSGQALTVEEKVDGANLGISLAPDYSVRFQNRLVCALRDVIIMIINAEATMSTCRRTRSSRALILGWSAIGLMCTRCLATNQASIFCSGNGCLQSIRWSTSDCPTTSSHLTSTTARVGDFSGVEAAHVSNL